jgi:hypothetical protein
MKYTTQTLIEFCNEKNIKLINEYNNIKINRDSYIEGECINKICCNKFNKKFRQLVETGAYCDLCIKEISNNKIRSSKVKYDINILTDFCNKNKIVLTNDYSNQFINRDTVINGMCLYSDCKNIFTKPLRQLLKINGYCEKCSKENGKIKIKETNLIKFGVENVMNNNEIKEKQKNTILEKYGVEHISKLEEIKEQKKIKSLEKYGVEYVLQSKEIREKIINTNIKKYGFENPQQNQDIRNKTNDTNINKYNCKSPVGDKIVQQKVSTTNLEKYGVPHHSQNAEVANTMMKKSFNKKVFTLPSGKLIDYQGYENFAWIELLNIEKICQDDIITNRNEVPEIWYNDKNGKKRRHYVDFYIKSQNRCIEVKSSWTNQEKNNVFEKQKSAKDLGLKYDIWIYDKTGNKIHTY